MCIPAEMLDILGERMDMLDENQYRRIGTRSVACGLMSTVLMMVDSLFRACSDVWVCGCAPMQENTNASSRPSAG